MLFDLDISSNQIWDQKSFLFSTTLQKIYFGIDRKLTRKLSLAVGLTYNLLITDTKDSNYITEYSEISPYSLTNSTTGRGLNLKTWVGGKIAIRFF